MIHTDIDQNFIKGAASAEPVNGGIRPWRLPHYRQHLFPSPGGLLLEKALKTADVRLRFDTDATAFVLEFEPLEPAQNYLEKGHAFDVVIDNRIIQSAYCKGHASSAQFKGLPEGRKIVDIWLPPTTSVTLTGLKLEKGSFAFPAADHRPLWATWGSSLTHCMRAGSAAGTWPAIVARKNNLNLINLGFGGQCCLDPGVAMYIRDLPADFITLKLGINTINKGMNSRIYSALVAAIIEIIREKHRYTPLTLISPIAYPPHETEPNDVGYTIEGMREDMEKVVRSFVETGDNRLSYVNGQKIFNAEDIAQFSADQCHPNAEGIELMAEKFNGQVIPLLINKTASPHISHGQDNNF